MRSKYKPGQVITIRDPYDYGDDNFSDGLGRFDEGGDEDQGEDEGEDDAHSVDTDLAIALARSFEHRPLSTSGCPCCNLGNGLGYLCPDPIMDGTSVLVSPGHAKCAACDRQIPLIPNSVCCAVCTRTACPELGPAWTCEPDAPTFPIRPLEDIRFPAGPDSSLLRYFTIEYERKAIVTYARDQKLSALGLFENVLRHHGGQGLPRASWHGLGQEPLDPQIVKLSDRVCYSCAKDLVAANVFEWWKSVRPTLSQYPHLLSRPNCKFGIACSQAQTDAWHARANNHICLPTRGNHPNDIRNQTGACEDGNRMVCQQHELRAQAPFPFSPSELQFRDKGGEPVFLCSSVVPSAEGGASTIPGKMTLWADRVAAYYAFGGGEHEAQGTIRLLIDTQNMCWVRTSRGQIPAGYRPVFGGIHQMSGDSFYHCAVWWKGQRVPGLVQAGQDFACITWNGEVCTIGAEYELLCWRR
ncbi:hypothetical protein FRC08_013039 [Ceratobasidium sp. 394]|nr:hypothetical protein FRC08_013039 [Ceratobasidium sp. 394]